MITNPNRSFKITCTIVPCSIHGELKIGNKKFPGCRDEKFVVAMWQHFGRIFSEHSLSDFVFKIKDVGEEGHGIDSLALMAPCLAAFFDELKHNKTIRKISLDVFAIPMFDLTRFLQNGYTESLTLESNSESRVTQETLSAISTALECAHLKELNIQGLHINDENQNNVFRQVVKSCAGVTNLFVDLDSDCSYIVALLRNPKAATQSMTISGYSTSKMVQQRAICEIASSLRCNTKLKELNLGFTLAPNEINVFENVLCDASSIESICKSNHTLGYLHVAFEGGQLAEASVRILPLKLNRNENKTEVIQNKIMQYYFIGDCDMNPFVSMPISVLPEVMRLGEGMSNKQNSIFKLLKSIPELCCVLD